MTIKRRTGRIITIAAMLLAAALCMLAAAEPAHAMTARPLAGKRVLVDGDSIQHGFGKYAATAAKSMGAKVKNQSRNCATVARGRNKKNSTWYRISKMSDAQIRMYDYVIVTTGTNDYYSYYKVKPGTADSYDVRTTGGALNYVIRRIQAASPGTKIVVVTPIHRFAGKKNCDSKKNRFGYTLADYRNVISATAAQYDNVYLIQGTDISRANEMNKRKNTRDGLHPKKKYAQRVLAVRFAALFTEKVIDQPAAQAAQAAQNAQATQNAQASPDAQDAKAVQDTQDDGSSKETTEQ